MANVAREPAREKGVRVLSLDGGGVGALLQVLILDRIMYRIKNKLGLDITPAPCEYFELIGGSGTGGIVALMLGRLRMSIADTISACEKLHPQTKIGFSEEFQASKFEEVLKDIFKQEKMRETGPDVCKTFVCAMNVMNMNGILPELFRSYNTSEEPASDCMIWEAARATSAMPGLFKPMEIGLGGTRQRYIDGGVGHNNPTSLVLAEAEEIYPARPVVLVVSLGSGHPDIIQIPASSSASAVAKAMKGIATNCEKTHEETARRFRTIPNTYFRFNVEQGMQGLAPQDWENSSQVSAHTKAYLTTEDVKSKLTATVEVILNPVIPVAADSPVYLKVCPTPTFRFTGRKDILRKMTEYFNTDVGRRHIFLLHGLGGAGKSQLAFKFVEESTMPEPRFTEIYFVDSTSQQTVENDLITLAIVRKHGKTPHDSLLWLSHQCSEWLIVFNNADDPNLNLVQYFPSGSHGNILITSRNPDLRQHAQAEHKVDRMELQEATELLLSTAKCDITEPETSKIAEKLVKKLHCLPLAVAQAGAYIFSSGALQTYLDLYESTVKRIQLLNQRPSQSDYEWSVYTTWQISFEKVSKQAAYLLQLCSFLHHEAITEEIFKQAALYELIPGGPTEADLHEPLEFLAGFHDPTGSRWDSMKFIGLTDELGCFSLIEFHRGMRTITFSVHPLVHEWCRTTVKLDAPTELCMHKLMGMSISSTDNFRLEHQIFPHLDSLLFKTTDQGNRRPYIMDTLFAWQCLYIYHKEGKWDNGVELGNHMLQTGRLQQPELETLKIEGVLAVIYGGKGDFHRKREIEEVVLTRRTELLGEDHPDTLTAMGNLAMTLSALGKSSKAEELKMIVLDKCREILGEDHPETLRAMANLAVTYSALGQSNKADELETIVLDKRREILGEDHPATLLAMANLAATLSDLGQSNKAAELERIVLDKRREILGEDHPATLSAMANLAVTLSALGHFNKAEELETIVLDKRKQILGEDHPDTLGAMANLAVTFSALGQSSKAEELKKIVLDKHRQILGENHPATLSAMANLAVTLSALGHFNKAEELETIVLDKRRELLGEDHPATLLAMANLAATLSDLGHFNKAEELETIALDKRRQILGNDHPATLLAMANLAATLSDLGQSNEAEELETIVLDKRRQILGEDHPDTLLAMANLAATLSALGQFNEAEELEMIVLDKHRQILGEDHPATLLAMANLAVVLSALGQFNKAEELQKIILNKHREILGDDHPDMLRAMVNLAATHGVLDKSAAVTAYTAAWVSSYAAFPLLKAALACGEQTAAELRERYHVEERRARKGERDAKLEKGGVYFPCDED
ncbi:hypothetical protein FB451DRAFT_1556471 [Mycena latifolia]|nr:hypothetical protein FB451DRAFT_1556471 [Mycena latifolia]